MPDAGTRRAGLDVAVDRSTSVSRPVWVAALTAALVTGMLLRIRTSPDVDLWLHLRIGDLLRDGVRFGPGPDPLAALADRTYVPTQWLAQVMMSGVHDAAGVAGIQVVRLVLVTALGGLVLLGCRVVAGPAAAGFATALTMAGTAIAWGERPQLAGMVLLAATVAIWWRASTASVVPWLVVPLTWLWACLHGSWLLGAAVGAVLVVGGVLDGCWRGRRAVLVAATPVAAVAVAALTPLGSAAVLEPFHVGTAARLTVNEWQRPALGNPLLLIVLSACVVAVLGIVRSGDRRWSHGLSVVVAVVLALWMVRTIAVAAVVVAPAVAHGLDVLARRRGTGGHVIAGVDPPRPVSTREKQVWLLAAALVLVLGGSQIVTSEVRAPVADTISDAIAALPPAAVLAVDARAVGWTQWAHPERRPMRDLRAEVYSEPVALAYKDFQEARPGWQAYAAAHGVTAVLAYRDGPLDPAMAEDASWSAVAEDPRFRLWVKR